MLERETHNNKTSAALILAAGEGSRMGGRPKCLIKIDHQPMILRQLQILKAAGISQITIVTGFYYEQIEAVIAADTSLNIIRNPQPEQGQQSSVGLGLKNLPDQSDLILIALADQPLVDESDLEELLRAYDKRPPNTEILYPVVSGQRGNPVLMSAACVNEFLRDKSGITCRQYIDRHASSVYQYATENEHFITDLDTPDDLAKLQSQTGLNISL
jgi:CTP:molybdopterin cytidylyltransferase MocA